MSKYLIVGQGLAGTLLAFSLLEKGEEVLIADDYKHASASQVAAGMWNPVTFKRLAASWLAKEMLEEMNVTFRKLEEKLQTSFFHSLPVARIFNSIQDANFWDEKSDHPEVGKYLSARTNKSVQENFNAPFGNSEVNECGWLNVPLFREVALNYFIRHENFIEEAVNENEVEFNGSKVLWKERMFDKLILCNGIGVNQWKGLEHLDLIPNLLAFSFIILLNLFIFFSVAFLKILTLGLSLVVVPVPFPKSIPASKSAFIVTLCKGLFLVIKTL